MEQEELLRAYFTGTDVEEDLKMYVPLFAHFKAASNQALGSQFDQKLKAALPQAKLVPIRSNRTWLRVAAVGAALLVAGMFLVKNNFLKPSQPTAIEWSKYEITDEQVAYEETVKALKLVSSKMHKGTSKASKEVDKMEKVSKYLN